MAGTASSARTMAHPIRWVKLTLPPPDRLEEPVDDPPVLLEQLGRDEPERRGRRDLEGGLHVLDDPLRGTAQGLRVREAGERLVRPVGRGLGGPSRWTRPALEQERRGRNPRVRPGPGPKPAWGPMARSPPGSASLPDHPGSPARRSPPARRAWAGSPRRTPATLRPPSRDPPGSGGTSRPRATCWGRGSRGRFRRGSSSSGRPFNPVRPMRSIPHPIVPGSTGRLAPRAGLLSRIGGGGARRTAGRGRPSLPGQRGLQPGDGGGEPPVERCPGPPPEHPLGPGRSRALRRASPALASAWAGSPRYPVIFAIRVHSSLTDVSTPVPMFSRSWAARSAASANAWTTSSTYT